MGYALYILDAGRLYLSQNRDYMKPLDAIRRPVLARIRRDKHLKLLQLASEEGLRIGPFSAHVLENIAECPPEHFHEAMAAFLTLSRRRS